MSNALTERPGRPLSTVSLRTFFYSRCKSRQERQFCIPYVMTPSWSHSWAPALLFPPSLSLYSSRSVINSSQCLVTSSVLVCCGKGPALVPPLPTSRASFFGFLPTVVAPSPVSYWKGLFLSPLDNICLGVHNLTEFLGRLDRGSSHSLDRLQVELNLQYISLHNGTGKICFRRVDLDQYPEPLAGKSRKATSIHAAVATLIPNTSSEHPSSRPLAWSQHLIHRRAISINRFCRPGPADEKYHSDRVYHGTGAISPDQFWFSTSKFVEHQPANRVQPPPLPSLPPKHQPGYHLLVGLVRGQV